LKEVVIPTEAEGSLFAGFVPYQVARHVPRALAVARPRKQRSSGPSRSPSDRDDL